MKELKDYTVGELEDLWEESCEMRRRQGKTQEECCVFADRRVSNIVGCTIEELKEVM